jgi:glycosyltransferase involved in cell wall biosynthesis
MTTAPPSPLKILHLIATLPVGGAEDLVAAIVRGLDPRRFAVEVACLGELGAVGQELARQGRQVWALNLDIKRTPFWRLTAEVRALLGKTKPDILHTHLYHPNLYGRLAALRLGLKGIVAAVHNSYTRPKLHRRLWNFLLAQTTDYILVGSSQVWHDVRTYDHVPAGKLILLPYGIDMAELACPLSRLEAQARLGVSGFVIGTVGRLEEQKGHSHLLAAMAQLLPDIPDLTLVLVGDGRQMEALQRQAQDLGLDPRVHFLGTRRDLPLIYRSLDVFVLPSLWEGLPLALLKAMGAGLPVLATRVSGVEEAIEAGVNGLLAPPAHAAALAQAILWLHQRPEGRAALGLAARCTIAARYSQEAMLARLAQIYTELGKKQPNEPLAKCSRRL